MQCIGTLPCLIYNIFLRFLPVGTGEAERGLGGADDAERLGVASPVPLIIFDGLCDRTPFSFIGSIPFAAFSSFLVLTTKDGVSN